MSSREDAAQSKTQDLAGSHRELAALMRSHDWATTPIGPPQSWPQPLKTLVDVMLAANQPMFIVWGPERTLIYNSSYAEILALKHPQALGRDILDVWSEIREELVPIVGQAYAGEPVHMDDITLFLERHGDTKESHFSFSYTPVRDEAGRVAGFFCPCTETTGEVLAERRAAAETERQRRLFEQAPGFITILSGPDHVFEFANSTYRRLFGDRDFIGKTVREAFPELAEQDFFDLLDRVYASGERFVANGIAIHLKVADGATEERFLDFIYEPVTDDAGRITGIFVEGHDVTDTRRAKAALGESEERLKRALEAGELGAWELDLNTLAAWRSPQHDRIFGYETMLPEWTYGGFLHHVVPEDRDWVDAAFQTAIAAKGLWDFECRIVRSDGETRWIWAQGRVDGGAAGAPERMKGTVRDVTGRRTVEERLRELNEGLEQRVAERTAERNRVWEMSRDLFAIMGFDGRLKAINPAWEATLGRDTETLLSLSFREHIHPDDDQAVRAVIERLLRGESVERFENRLPHGDGSWRWISWTLVPEGEVFYAVGRDVTAQKEAATELEHAQEALRQSQKMEAMGQLTGGVAHDFNNLLTPIIGGLDMLQRNGLGSEREQRLIAGAMQSADRAKTLVQRLLAFARRQPLQPTAVDVARLVTGMSDLVASTSGPQIRVVVEAASDLPPAKADLNQLEMALLNLGVNARDAMPDGGTIRISASAEQVAAGHRSGLRPAEYICLSVADTGVGMDEETQRRAIEPFFSTKGVGKGTGLGLSMVHGLASQLAGALTIESRTGVGTNVELWLPLGEAEQQMPAGVQQAVPKFAAKGTALLVDDEELVRMSTADMLSDLGYAVVEAECAEEALRLLRGGVKLDLVVTDHLMPGMTGTELAHIIRSERPGVEILIVSGYAEAEGIAPNLPRLTKPFRRDDLAAKLQEAASLS
jgi:PAS domain S-box-containing protein